MRRSVWVVVAGLLLGACTQSQVAPDAEVTISGRFVAADGAPLSERPVALHVDPGPSVLLWVPAIVATLGTICATDLCGADHETTTDPAGRFTFDLRGDDVSGSFGEEVELLAEATGPASVDDQSGPSGRIRFVVRDESAPLPEVTLWAPPVRVVSDGVGWQPVPDTHPDVSGYEALFQTAGGDPVWRARATDAGLAVDARILEDTTGGVAGVATVAVSDADGVRGVELRTGTRRYRSLAGAPASRGGPCRLLADDGGRTVVSPCPVTDGDLATAPHLALPCPGEGPCPRVSGVEIGLGDAREIELVVVRGCAGCRLEAGDAATQLTDDATAVALDSRAATVVVTGELDGLREVSVWDGPGGGGLEAVTIDAPLIGGTELPADPADPRAMGRVDDRGTRPAWPILLATLLLGVALGGLAVSLLGRPGRSAVRGPD